MDLTFWVSLAALLAAVWAVVRAEKFVREHYQYLQSAEAHMIREGFVRIEGGAYKRTVLSMDGRMDAVESRLAALEERVGKLSDFASVVCPKDWRDDELPGVIRTTSGDRPEVRNVTNEGGEQ
jgi:hypothetical protein